MEYIKTYEQYSGVNEGIKEYAIGVFDEILSILPTQKRKIIKLLNNEDVTTDEMNNLLKNIFDSYPNIHKHIDTLKYNDALMLLSSVLKHMGNGNFKAPYIILKNGKLSLQ